MFHPDTPREVAGDAAKYAEWRANHIDPDEAKGFAAGGFTPKQVLAFFADEWHQAMDARHRAGLDDAELQAKREKTRTQVSGISER